MNKLKKFLLTHRLNLVLSEIDVQSKENKRLVTENFSFIEEDGETKLLKKLLIFLQKNELVSFELILACFRVQDFKVILKHFEILLVNDLISHSNLMLVLSKEKYLLDNPDHSGIIEKISEIISLVGIKDHDSLSKIWEHGNPQSLLYALELFYENNDIQLETVFKLAECLESDSLVSLANQSYDKENFDFNVIKEIALENILINEKRERLSDYFKSLFNKDETIEAQITTPYLDSVPPVQHMIYDCNAPTFFTPEVTRGLPAAEKEVLSLGKR